MKKGSKKEGADLTYSSNFSWQDPFKKLELAGIDGLQYSYDSYRNMQGTGPAGGFWRIDSASLVKTREWQELYGKTVKATDPVLYGRDWWWDGTQKFGYRIYDPISTMIKNWTFSENHNLSLNGKTGNTRYNVGFGYLNQTGMMKPAEHDDFKRLTANLKLETKVTDFLTIRGGALYSDRTKRYPNSTNSAGFIADPWLYLYRWSLLFPTGVKELGEEIHDPYWDAKNTNTVTDGKKYLGLNLGTTIDINKNWQIIADYVYDWRNETILSSLPEITLREHWYGVIPWVDENGDRVYVDNAGNVVETGGMPAFRFPLANYVTKEQSYVSQSAWTAQKHTINAYCVPPIVAAGGTPPTEFTSNKNVTDYPVLRYAEVLLNWIEAKAEMNLATQSDIDISINKIRNRPLAPEAVAKGVQKTAPLSLAALPVDPAKDPSVTDLLWEIRRERRMEFAFEYSRYQDLRRWKKLDYMDTDTKPDLLSGGWVNFPTEVPAQLTPANVGQIAVVLANGNVVAYDGTNNASMVGFFRVTNTNGRQPYLNLSGVNPYLTPVGRTQMDDYKSKGYVLAQTEGWPAYN
jgi:hypothetical protein